MKTYIELSALSKDEREAELKNSVILSIESESLKLTLQKLGGKIVAAMKISGDIGDRDISKVAKEITGHDIRTKLQNVYELANVMGAIILGVIELTETDYEKIGSSKLAYLSPLLADDASDELKAKIPKTVAMLKADKPAREISEFTRGASAEPKKVREAKESQAKAEAERDAAKAEAAETKEMLKNMTESGTTIPVGFLATDIGKDDPLVKSKQFKARIKADMTRAMDSNGDEIIDDMKDYFGKAFVTACNVLGEDPLDFLSEILGQSAKTTAGAVIDVPAIEVAA